MDFNQVLLEEIRENRKRIEKLTESLNGLKVKLGVISATMGGLSAVVIHWIRNKL